MALLVIMKRIRVYKVKSYHSKSFIDFMDFMDFRLASIFKFYDIRGLYPAEINEDLAYQIGQAYVKTLKPTKMVAVGMDARLHSSQLKEALIRGLSDGGVDVMDIGAVSTEVLYFTVGYYSLAGGIQVTASHYASEYNGFKLVREKAQPFFSETGLLELKEYILNGDTKVESERRGKIMTKDVIDDFADFVLRLVDKNILKRNYRLVINPNFGLEGDLLKRIIKRGGFDWSLLGLNDRPDGHFPKGKPDPLLNENRNEFIELVKSSGVDLGVTWDADADRVFFCSGQGVFVEPYFANVLLINYLLDKNPGKNIVYDPRYTWALIDAAKCHGSRAIPCRVGHPYIKAKMREVDAIFAGEFSGHTYFKDFWYADTGIVPLLIILEILVQGGQTLDQLLEPLWQKYFISGEINNIVNNAEEILNKVKEKYADAQFSTIDGLSIEYDRDWRANIRVSSEGPLRLNVEAKSQELMEEKRDELLKIIKD